MASGARARLVALTTNPEFERWPRWSADGSQLVISRVIGEHVAVVRINADGTGAASLTPAGMRWPMMMFSLSPSSSSRAPRIAASVSSRLLERRR